MNLRPTFLIAVTLFLTSSSAFSQYKHIGKKVNFKTKSSSLSTEKQTDNLGQILLSGYLDGKINGYRFSVMDSVTRWKPSEIRPDDWIDQQLYFSGDLVTFSGKTYRAISDNSVRPDNPQYWSRADLKDPVSRRWYFPTLADTLPKENFLDAMVQDWPERYQPWVHSNTYYQGDRVTYQGKDYEAETDINAYSRNPEIDANSWRVISNGVFFFPWTACDQITILFNYSVQKTDTVFVPEMISVGVFDYRIELNKDLCHFYYRDVMEYLKTVSQPVATNFKYGYINQVLELNYASRSECITWIKSKVKSKALKISDKNIIDPQKYQNWLSDTSTTQLDYNYRIFQHPVTHDVTLSALNIEQIADPFMTIPIKPLDKLFKKEKVRAPTISNYSAMLSDWKSLLPVSSKDYSYYDSLAPLTYTTVKPRTTADYEMIEAYTAHLNDRANQTIASLVPDAWLKIERAFFTGKLRDTSRDIHRSFFSDNYNWSNVTLGKEIKFDADFSLSGDRSTSGGFLFLPARFDALSIVYQKNFKNTGQLVETSVTPLTVTIYYDTQHDIEAYPETMQARGAAFKWTELKQLLLQEGQFAALIDAIENGKLNFKNSELMYGLKEK